MDSLIQQHPWHDWRGRLAGWRPRPNSGAIGKDIVFVLFIVFLQTTVFPALFGVNGLIDLVTPWLVITAVRQRPLQGTLLTLLAGFALETRLAVPAGLYLCTYWIMVNVFFQFRPALSWRYRTPWIVSYGVSSLWVVLCEMTVQSLINPSWGPGISDIALGLTRIGFAMGFGMFLSREWMRIDAEEPVPQ